MHIRHVSLLFKLFLSLCYFILEFCYYVAFCWAFLCGFCCWYFCVIFGRRVFFCRPRVSSTLFHIGCLKSDYLSSLSCCQSPSRRDCALGGWGTGGRVRGGGVLPVLLYGEFRRFIVAWYTQGMAQVAEVRTVTMLAPLLHTSSGPVMYDAGGGLGTDLWQCALMVILPHWCCLTGTPGHWHHYLLSQSDALSCHWANQSLPYPITAKRQARRLAVI